MQLPKSRRTRLALVAIVLVVASQAVNRIGGRSTTSRAPSYAPWVGTYGEAYAEPLGAPGGYGGPGGGYGGAALEPWLGGRFHANSNLGTAVSSDGESGYISLGGGEFVSW